MPCFLLCAHSYRRKQTSINDALLVLELQVYDEAHRNIHRETIDDKLTKQTFRQDIESSAVTRRDGGSFHCILDCRSTLLCNVMEIRE
jgi:hypothetical protein